jgi:hypothetical protein
MLYVSTTRFTDKTWKEREMWVRERSHNGCIYNTPMRISEAVPIRARMFVLEMNNDQNRIMGIGVIRNTLWNSKKLRIYQDHYYNRYCYSGKHRLDRSDLLGEMVSIEGVEIRLLRLLEVVCFMGSTHSKRNRGISLLPKAVIKNGHICIATSLWRLFERYYPGFIEVDSQPLRPPQDLVQKADQHVI